MDTPEFPTASFRRVRWACGAAVLAIASLAILGWGANWRRLVAFRSGSIPMAPNTAISFGVLGAALMLLSRRDGMRPDRRGTAGTAAALVALLCAARIGEYVARTEFGVDRLFVRVPAETSGLAPVGKMGLFTALLLLTSSTSIVLLSIATGVRRRARQEAAGVLGLIVILMGGTFLLGYLFDAPLLYGGPMIPMAMNSAIALVVLGTGLLAASGPGAGPLRWLFGATMRARLLREFLPFAAATVAAMAWLTHLVTRTVGDQAAALSAAISTVLVMAVVGFLCDRIARRVGGDLERAEEQLHRAHDELEAKVAERTRELTEAKELLEQRHRQLQQSAVEREQTAASVRQAHQELQAAHQELKKAESQLVQSEKLSALGQIVAGVAHEINNPLAYVTNNVAVLQREVGHLHRMIRLYQEAEGTLELHQIELLARIRDLAEQIDLSYVLENLDGLMLRSRDGLKRIQQIVKDLRDFARTDEGDLKLADLNVGILSTIGIMGSHARRQEVSLETELAPLPELTCYPAKINQVVLNLVANAIDACPAGGRVLVRSRAIEDGIEIEVSDNGSGIPEAIRDKIFDPFFTTKPIGKGTGLGLSISYGIVQSHGGRIDVESPPGQGCRFLVRLPRGARSAAPPSGERRHDAAPGDSRHLHGASAPDAT